MAKPATSSRRSICPVSCTLDIVGDRWTLLVVRDLICGRTRFKEFLASPEAIPTNILADRLKRLEAHKLIATAPVEPGSPRLAYHLTAKGRALRPMLSAMRAWGLRWEKGTKAVLRAAA